MESDQSKLQCPALLIAASGYNQGRTTVTAALARYHRNQGRNVRVFKAGPDFLDPLIHECASGQVVDNLDLWMVGETRCQNMLYSAAQEADLILVECSTGLYDTNPVCAEIASRFGLPIMLVVDGSEIQSGSDEFIDDLVSLGSDLPISGVLVNRVGDNFNPEPVRIRLQDGIEYYGHLPDDKVFKITDRHQDLLLEREKQALDQQFDRAAELVAKAGITQLPAAVSFQEIPQAQIPPLLEGVRIGVARDEGFAFIYHANLELLKNLGAEVVFFSPLHDRYLPNVHSLWFPGGYPELYMEELAANITMKASIREFHNEGKHILAECGGMMYMLGSLVDRHGIESRMVGLLPGRGQMLEHLAGLGMHSVTIDDQNIRGHVFHHSRMESGMEPVTVSDRRHGRRPGETLYQLGNLVASYVHFYFPSNPLLTAKFFGSSIFSNHDY
ncbi:MAG: cobyrinate a,c-diamide synthase [Motiliproteus sp.]|nr:cobyrinate a,c-diamide synthase [Motiliproteus sp.]MCW9051641.1 cobyrinate a,c-diamide synthase [Motiliproteus sp.]